MRNITYAQFCQGIAKMREDGLVHPNFAIDLGKANSIGLWPHRRSHHPITWLLPIYHNDNVR